MDRTANMCVTAPKRADKNQWTARLALQSLQFWLLFIARIAAAAGTTVIVTHQVAHVVDVGFSKLLSASIFRTGRDYEQLRPGNFRLHRRSLVQAGGLHAQHRDDRRRRKRADGSQQSESNLVALRLRDFFGIGFGSRAVIFSALTADIFSGKGFGSILGYSTVAVGVGGALGSWLGGAFYDWTGSYLVSFGLSALVLSVSDICIWLAAVPSVADYDKRLWASQENVSPALRRRLLP